MEGVEEFNNTQFNFFEAKEKYLQRVRDISDNNDDNNNNNNNNNNNGGKRRHRLSNTNEVLVNPNPVLFFKDDVERHREVFENLKVAYMEQETKEKFLRSILLEPAMLVEQEDVMAIEEENKQKKAELKEEKRKVGDIQKEMEKLSRQLCEDYEDLTHRVQETTRLYNEMQEMQRELEELEAQNRQLAIQGYSDQSETSGMSMEDLLTYTEKYTVESEELEQQIIKLEDGTSQASENKSTLNQQIAALVSEKKTLEFQAQSIKQDAPKVLKSNESTAKWYRYMNTVLEKLFDIQDLKINQDQDKKSTILTFRHGDWEFTTYVSKITNELESAQVKQIDQKVVDKIVENTLKMQKNSRLQLSHFVHEILMLT